MRALLSVLVVLLFLSACKRNSNDGMQVVPNEDQLNVLEQELQNIIVYTKPDFVTPTRDLHHGGLSHLLGSVDDPVFGHSSVGILLGFEPFTTNLFEDAEQKLDSVQLLLRVSRDFYGDTTGLNNINVYMVSTGLSANDTMSNYYPSLTDTIASYSFAEMNNNWKEYLSYDTIVMNDVDGKPIVKTNGDTAIALIPATEEHYIRLDLDPNIFLTDETDLSSFTESFNDIRLFVEGDKENGGAGFFEIASYFSSLRISSQSFIKDTIFNVDGDAVTINSYWEKRQRFLEVNENTESINTYGHDYSGAEIEDYISSPDSILGEDAAYIHTLDGSYAKLEFPELNLIDNRFIHNAVLTIEVDEAENSFALPEQLYLSMEVNSELAIALPDDSVSVDYGYIRGVLSGNSYTFNITRYIQGVINGKYENRGLHLRALDRFNIASRVKIKGNNRTDKGVQLKIKYTEIN